MQEVHELSGRRIHEMWVWWLVSKVSRWGIQRKAGLGKEGEVKRLDSRKWAEVTEGMTVFVVRERGADISPLPLRSSGTCWSLLFSPFTCTELCVWVPYHSLPFCCAHSAFSGFWAS